MDYGQYLLEVVAEGRGLERRFARSEGRRSVQATGAAGVALAALEALSRGENTSAAELRPNYLRQSQAVRERAEKMKQEEMR